MTTFFYLSLSILTSTSYAGWQDLANEADSLLRNTTGQDGLSNVTSSLSNEQISKGLKQALDLGVKKAIELLGKENGFLKDQSVKIPLPDKMRQVEKTLRSFGQEKMADEFVVSMNRAAEKAVPEVTHVFVNSIAKMSMDDARQILSGTETAATDYFKKNTSDELSQLIKPYVTDAMNQAQVTQYYKALVGQVKRYDNFGLMESYLGNAAEIDKYVTDKTMAGLFSKIAQQEKLIRENPAERTTDILKDVFGSVIK